MMPPMIELPAKADLVAAYEALRETVISPGAHSTEPLGERRLLREGLLSWGRHYGASGAPSGSLHPALGRAPLGLQTWAAPPQAAIVSVMATMALQSLSYQESLS